jgi:uncharacterized membrane protein YfcA
MIVTAIPAGFAAGLFGIGGGLNNCSNFILYFWISRIRTYLFDALSCRNFIWNNYSLLQ